MSETHSMAMEFAALAQRLQGSDFEMTLEEVLKAAVETVDADLGGIMLVRKGKVESVAVIDDVVREADRLQLEAGDGPCLDAIEEGSTFIIDDTATEERWPQWCRAVHELGIRSVLSVQLHTATGLRGALNLYSSEANEYSRDDAETALILATHASVALAADKERAEFKRAIDGRHMIGMAQGILMERFSLKADQAFSVLRRYSQDRNVKLREVAEQLVESRALPA